MFAGGKKRFLNRAPCEKLLAPANKACAGRRADRCPAPSALCLELKIKEISRFEITHNKYVVMQMVYRRVRELREDGDIKQKAVAL